MKRKLFGNRSKVAFIFVVFLSIISINLFSHCILILKVRAVSNESNYNFDSFRQPREAHLTFAVKEEEIQKNYIQ